MQFITMYCSYLYLSYSSFAFCGVAWSPLFGAALLLVDDDDEKDADDFGNPTLANHTAVHTRTIPQTPQPCNNPFPIINGDIVPAVDEAEFVVFLKIPPNTIPVNTIPILTLPLNIDKVVARELLFSTEALIAEPNTGHAKPRTKLNNKLATTALPILVHVAVVVVVDVVEDGVAAIKNRIPVWQKVDKAIKPYANADVHNMNDNNRSVPPFRSLFVDAAMVGDNIFRIEGASKAPTAEIAPHPA